MKIYDCFTFYNEYDLLELRLNELYAHVDHFVIVEGNTTFTNLPKPFYFEENADRFKQWADKIIHVKVKMPGSSDPWTNEAAQRNAILNAVQFADPDDIIVISDVDEIVRATTIDQMRADETTQVWGLRMPIFNFKFNYMLVTSEFYSVWGMAGRMRVMVAPEQFRRQRFEMMTLPTAYRDSAIRVMEHAGWHFTYLGNTKFAETKIKSFAHTETNTPEIIAQLDVDRSIANGDGIYFHPGYKYSPVQLNEYFPATVVNNQTQYSAYILGNADKTALDFLPN